MRIQRKREWVPWAMAGARAVLGPALIAGAACRWNGMVLAVMVLAALLSDIYDGILARRWQCDTAALRLTDTLADTVFYLCTAAALWIAVPALWQRYAAPLIWLLTLEGVRFGFDLAKFGKPASYHSLLAKTWGLVMACAVMVVLVTGRPSPLVFVALLLGIACDVEGLAMSLVMPVWRQDVKGLCAAWRLRHCPAAIRRSGWRPAQFAMLAALLSLPLCAIEGGHAAYVSGTSTSVTPGTLGTLDARSAEVLVFHAAGATGKDVTIPYAAVRSFRYSSEVARHLGVLPAIAVTLVRARERRHYLSITYADAAQIPQVALLEIPAHEARSWLTILRARAPQACGTWVAVCGGYVK